MYRLWSEWDIGESNVIFASTEAGMRWLRNHAAVAEIAREEDVELEHCITYCFDTGLFGWIKVDLIE